VRLTIRHKLFLALLLAVMLVAAAMYGFIYVSFRQGFVSFLESRQQVRAERMVERLAEIHAAEGGWQGLLADRQRWWSLQAEGHPVPGAGMGHGPWRGQGGGMRRLGAGFVLMDADRTPLLGPPVDPGTLILSPIKVEGRTVGYLGRQPGPALSEVVDIRFVESQQRAFIWIALAVATLAVALSWPLANALVRPVRRVADAARALAAGRYATRVPVQSGDELGDLARDFNALAQALERTESARRQWMADISHELRTPLSLLRAELEAVQDGVRPFDATTVDSLRADIDRLGRLVEDLYQLSMTDLGAMSYRKRAVDPVALLADDVEVLSGEFQRRGLGIELRDTLGRTVTLHADPDRLSQLYRNLMQNSLRYTDAGGRLEISAAGIDGRLVLDFADSAPGVPEAAMERLFERFYRVEASRSREHGGAGLGLAICRNIVEAHDGRVEARPSPLGGVLIHVELPLAS
jgi:two-component system sensor histidine kinase BaeS